MTLQVHGDALNQDADGADLMHNDGNACCVDADLMRQDGSACCVDADLMHLGGNVYCVLLYLLDVCGCDDVLCHVQNHEYEFGAARLF
ncbi:MAG: hypothetical protein ACRCXC_13625 [Legionella sp.]